MQFPCAAISERNKTMSGGKALQSDTKAFLTGARAVWRMKWIVLLVAILSSSAVYFQQSRKPRDFEANADLLFRFGREYYPISPGEQRRNWGENVIVSLDAAIFTEMRLLNSHHLFERSLDTVDIDELFRQKQGRAASGNEMKPEVDRRLEAVRMLADSVSISRVEGAALVEIAARHPVPEVADRILNAHIDNYLAWRSELFDRDASSYFEVQLALAREEHATLIDSRKALVAEYGIVDVELEREILRRNLERLGSDEENSESSGSDSAAMQEIRERLQRINTFESLVQPVDARIRAIIENIAALESEEANWRLTQDFGLVVAPSVVAIDFRTAHGSPVGLSAEMAAGLAGFLSTVLAALVIAGFGLFSSAVAGDQRSSAGSSGENA